MAIPAYMWLTDDQGNEISGSVQVAGRTGSIEILEYAHNIYKKAQCDHHRKDL